MTRGQDERRPIVEEEGGAGVLARVRLALAVVALAALTLFLLQNLQEVQVHFLWFDWSTRMLWALLASAAVGAVIAAILFGALLRRGRQ